MRALSGTSIIPAPMPNTRIKADTIIKAVEFGIKLNVDTIGTKIAQTVIVVEPVYMLLTFTELMLFLAET